MQSLFLLLLLFENLNSFPAGASLWNARLLLCRTPVPVFRAGVVFVPVHRRLPRTRGQRSLQQLQPMWHPLSRRAAGRVRGDQVELRIHHGGTESRRGKSESFWEAFPLTRKLFPERVGVEGEMEECLPDGLTAASAALECGGSTPLSLSGAALARWVFGTAR